MAQDKKSIIVYSDWINKFEALTDDEAGRLIKHFFRYINDQEPVAPDRITELSFIDIEQCLKRDLKKWEKRAERSRENGKNGGRPSTIENPKKPKETHQVIYEPKKPDSVNDNVTVNVSVNDNVNGREEEKEESPLPEIDFVLLKKLMSYFGFTESANYDKMRDVGNFLKCLMIQKKEKYFSDQFSAYTTYKSINDSFKHSFKKFLGSHEKLYEDGAWNAENWIVKLNEEKNKQNGRETKTRNTGGRSNQGLHNASGYTPI